MYSVLYQASLSLLNDATSLAATLKWRAARLQVALRKHELNDPDSLDKSVLFRGTSQLSGPLVVDRAIIAPTSTRNLCPYSKSARTADLACDASPEPIESTSQMVIQWWSGPPSTDAYGLQRFMLTRSC